VAETDELDTELSVAMTEPETLADMNVAFCDVDEEERCEGAS